MGGRRALSSEDLRSGQHQAGVPPTPQSPQPAGLKHHLETPSAIQHFPLSLQVCLWSSGRMMSCCEHWANERE